MPAEDRSGNFVSIAKIIREWGIKGALKTLPLSSILSSLKIHDAIWLTNSSGLRERKTITYLKPHGKHYIFSLEGIYDIDSAKALRGVIIEIGREDLPDLKDGEYYQDDIIGLTVMTLQGQTLGAVTDILSTGSNDVYVVHNGKRECLIPAIGDIIKRIDISERRIIIDPIEGLID